MTEHEASRTLVKSPPELWAECSDAESLARHLGQFGEIRITRLDPETTVAWEGERARGTVRIEPAGWGTKVILTAAPVAEEGEAAPVAEEGEAAPVTEEADPVSVAQVVPVIDGEPAGAEEAAPAGGAAQASEASAPVEAPEPAPHAPEPAPDAPEPIVDAPKRRRRFARLLGLLRPPRPEVRDAGDPHPPAGVPPPPSPQEPASPEPPPSEQPPPVAQPLPPPEPRASSEPCAPSASAEPPARADQPTIESPAVPDAEAVLTAALDSLGQAHHRPYSRS